jgi:outer membrane protein assembly factor BamB
MRGPPRVTSMMLTVAAPRVIVIVLGVVFPLLAPAAPVVQQALEKEAPWPMYGRSPSHSQQPSGPALPTGRGRGWVQKAGGWVYGAPCVGADETVYFGSWDGHLYAVGPDGKLRWRVLVGAAFGLASRQIWSSPALSPDGRTVYIGANNSLVAVAAQNLDADSVPSLRWRVRTGAAVFASPTVAPDGIIFIGGLDSIMRAVRPDGTTLWLHHATAPIYASAALSADALFFSTLLDGRVVCLTRADGRLRWAHAPSIAPVPSSPALSPDGGTVYR